MDQTTPKPKPHGAIAWAANKKKEDPTYFQRMGQKGGLAPHTARGFQLMTREQIQAAGAKGGRRKRERREDV